MYLTFSWLWVSKQQDKVLSLTKFKDTFVFQCWTKRMFISAVLFLGILSLSQGLEVIIELDRVYAQVEPEFLSVTIDSVILKPPKWRTFNFR